MDVQAPPAQAPAQVAALQRQVLQFLTVAAVFDQVAARLGVDVPVGEIEQVLGEAEQQAGGRAQLAAQLGAPAPSLVDEALRIASIQSRLADEADAQRVFEEVVEGVKINPRYGRLDLEQGVLAPDRGLSAPLGAEPDDGAGLG